MILIISTSTSVKLNQFLILLALNVNLIVSCQTLKERIEFREGCFSQHRPLIRST